jgi:hypothetical protein
MAEITSSPGPLAAKMGLNRRTLMRHKDLLYGLAGASRQKVTVSIEGMVLIKGK